MNTARRLWLGFGLIMLVIVVAGVLLVVRVPTVDQRVREMSDARNLHAAVIEMRMGMQGYVLAVRAYLQTGEAQLLDTMKRNAAEVDRALAWYRELAHDERRQLMAARAEDGWKEIHVLGDALVAPEDLRMSLPHSRRFLDLRMVLEPDLEQMQDDALAQYNLRKDLALRTVDSVREMIWWLFGLGSLLTLGAGILTTRAVLRAEQRLHAGREVLEVTLASIDDGVITTDREARITFANCVALRMLGLPRDQALGSYAPNLFRLLSERERHWMENPALEVLHGGSTWSLTRPTLMVARDGSERPIDAVAAPIFDAGGATRGAVVILRDVSERKRMENELRQSAEDLREADRRKDLFLTVLAHELRNPLAPMSYAIQSVRRHAGLGDGVQAAVDLLERQLQQMVRLVDDLLDTSRISRGTIELRRATLDVRELARQAVDDFRPEFDARRVQLSARLPAQAVWVDGDAARLNQVIGNVLNNAAKFTAAGGRVQLSLSVEDDAALLRVKDNGIGISADQLPRVFEPFQQLSSYTSADSGGFGIGLTVARSLVELHGGAICLRSEGLGKGCEVEVRLPLAVAAPAPAAQPPAPAPVPVGARRVLVVDDNPDTADSMAALLELGGHQVRVARDGMGALDAFAEWLPDVVLLDVGLPGISGLEVARRIRQRPEGQAVKLIAVTGWGQQEDRRQSAQAGFDAHLVKPADYDRIMGLIAPSDTAPARDARPSVA